MKGQPWTKKVQTDGNMDTEENLTIVQIAGVGELLMRSMLKGKQKGYRSGKYLQTSELMGTAWRSATETTSGFNISPLCQDWEVHIHVAPMSLILKA